MNKDVEIRELLPIDLPYIYSTWLKHHKHSSESTRRIRNDTYYEKHLKIIKSILNRARTLIAHPKGDRDVILGYFCYEGLKTSPVVHFIYVKRHFRRMGIAGALIGGVDVSHCSFSHWTYDCDWICSHKRWNSALGVAAVINGVYPDAAYDPYLMHEDK